MLHHLDWTYGWSCTITMSFDELRKPFFSACSTEWTKAVLYVQFTHQLKIGVGMEGMI